MRRASFNPQELLDAVDARRRERGMTWADVSKELFVSVSTIRGMPKRRWGIELDGVIGMAKFVGRSVESFANGDGSDPPDAANYAKFRRFDTAALHDAVNDERVRRGLTWDQVAVEIWPDGPWGAGQLTGMAKGGRSDVYKALAICGWLGRTIQSFQRKKAF